MFRLTNRVDPEFLWLMLYEAAYWRDTGNEERPPLDSVREDPVLARYVEDWGRDGDTALVALDRHGEPVGAAWYRVLPAGTPGYGYVADDVPEVAIGVYPELRGGGLGSLLLGSLIVRARAHDVRALSLSVALDNPARGLYRKLGFTDHAEAHGTVTMLLELR